jgi:WD40 repeat protein
VIAISWSSDGNALASIIVDDTSESQIQIWDMTTGSLNTSIKPETWPHLTAFSPDGQLLLSAQLLLPSSRGGTYQLWEARTGTMIGQRESLWGAQRLQFSEDANMIDTGLNRLELASFYPGWVPTDSTEFFLTGNWVRQGQLALLLPNDDPPTCAATADGVLIMGHESGRVTFLELGEE